MLHMNIRYLPRNRTKCSILQPLSHSNESILTAIALSSMRLALGPLRSWGTAGRRNWAELVRGCSPVARSDRTTLTYASRGQPTTTDRRTTRRCRAARSARALARPQPTRSMERRGRREAASNRASVPEKETRRRRKERRRTSLRWREGFGVRVGY